MSRLADRMNDYDSFTLVVYDRNNKMVRGGSYSSLELATREIPRLAENAFAYTITAKKDGVVDDITTRFSSYLRQVNNDPYAI